MKCPKCGQELKPSKKDPDYMLCFDCKKKYRFPAKADIKQERRPERKVRDEEEDDNQTMRYSNIPPKNVRDKREKEMRKAYGDMLSAEEGSRRRKKVRQEEFDDDFDYEDEKVSKAPIIILGIAILVVAGLIIYMLLK